MLPQYRHADSPCKRHSPRHPHLAKKNFLKKGGWGIGWLETEVEMEVAMKVENEVKMKRKEKRGQRPTSRPLHPRGEVGPSQVPPLSLVVSFRFRPALLQ